MITLDLNCAAYWLVQMFYLKVTLIAALFSWTLKADLLEICLDCYRYHSRSRETVFVITRCRHFYHLDCITRQFVIQPTGSRQCGYCRQNPLPVLHWHTGESYPDTFFPNQTFYDACYDGDLDQVEKSLAEGVNVNAVMTDDFTSLMLASSGGHTDVVERLINAGANVNAAMTSNGATPLFFAAWKGHTDCMKILINAGADLNAARTSDGATPLLAAAEKGNTVCVKALVNAEADLNAARTSDGATPLSIATRLGHTDCVEALTATKERKETKERHFAIQ